MDELERTVREGLASTPLTATELEQLRQISESARERGSRRGSRGLSRWLVAVSAAVVVLGGASAALASPGGQGALRTAGLIPAATPTATASGAVATLSCALQLVTAPGASETDPAAQRALADGQAWLDRNPISVTVMPAPTPSGTSSLSALSFALQQAYQAGAKAAAAQSSEDLAAAAHRAALQRGLTRYLSSRADDPSLVVLDAGAVSCGPSAG